MKPQSPSKNEEAGRDYAEAMKLVQKAIELMDKHSQMSVNMLMGLVASKAVMQGMTKEDFLKATENNYDQGVLLKSRLPKEMLEK